MTKEVDLDLRFLPPKVERRFKKKTAGSFERAYTKSLAAISDPTDLPYCPKLYVFPYLIEKKIPIGRGATYRLTYFALSSVDPADMNRLAVYGPTYLRRLPEKYIISVFAHELAHVIDRKGNVDSYLEYVWTRLSRGFVRMREEQEAGALAVYDYFVEPVRSWLFEWENNETRGKYTRIVRKGARFLDLNHFLEYILGNGYQGFVTEKAAEIKGEIESRIREESGA